jgi:chloramphenicol 3-O phosphotransferase
MSHETPVRAARGHPSVILINGCSGAGKTSIARVGVRCDLEDLRRREAARPDRTRGHMQTHFDIVHAHGVYGVEVDTTASPTWRCADAIIAAIKAREGDSAFARLRAQRPPATSRIAPVT